MVLPFYSLLCFSCFIEIVCTIITVVSDSTSVLVGSGREGLLAVLPLILKGLISGFEPVTHHNHLDIEYIIILRFDL